MPTLELPERDDQLAVTPPDFVARAPVRRFITLYEQRDKRGVVRRPIMLGFVTPRVVVTRVVNLRVVVPRVATRVFVYGVFRKLGSLPNRRGSFASGTVKGHVVGELKGHLKPYGLECGNLHEPSLTKD